MSQSRKYNEVLQIFSWDPPTLINYYKRVQPKSPLTSSDTMVLNLIEGVIKEWSKFPLDFAKQALANLSTYSGAQASRVKAKLKLILENKLKNNYTPSPVQNMENIKVTQSASTSAPPAPQSSTASTATQINAPQVINYLSSDEEEMEFDPTAAILRNTFGCDSSTPISLRYGVLFRDSSGFSAKPVFKDHCEKKFNSCLNKQQLARLKKAYPIPNNVSLQRSVPSAKKPEIWTAGKAQEVMMISLRNLAQLQIICEDAFGSEKDNPIGDRVEDLIKLQLHGISIMENERKNAITNSTKFSQETGTPTLSETDMTILTKEKSRRDLMRSFSKKSFAKKSFSRRTINYKKSGYNRRSFQKKPDYKKSYKADSKPYNKTSNLDYTSVPSSSSSSSSSFSSPSSQATPMSSPSKDPPGIRRPQLRSGWQIAALLQRMGEGYKRSGNPRYYQERSETRVSQKASIQPANKLNIRKTFGDRETFAMPSDRRSVRSDQRIPLQIIPGYKTRKNKNGDRSQGTKSKHCKSHFHHEYSGQDAETGDEEIMAHEDRLIERLSPHPNLQTPPQISPLHDRKFNVPVQGTTFRSVLRPKNFYQDNARSHATNPQARHRSVGLPRRFVNHLSIRSKSRKKYSNSSQTTNELRIRNKSEKVITDTLQPSGVPGIPNRLEENETIHPIQKDYSSSERHSQLHQGKEGFTQKDGKSTRKAAACRNRYLWRSSYDSSPPPFKKCNAKRRRLENKSLNEDSSRGTQGASNLASNTFFKQGETTYHTNPLTNDNNRRFLDRMGSNSLQGKETYLQMLRPLGHTSYNNLIQQERDSSVHSGDKQISSTHKVKESHIRNRQRYKCKLLAQNGWKSWKAFKNGRTYSPISKKKIHHNLSSVCKRYRDGEGKGSRLSFKSFKPKERTTAQPYHLQKDIKNPRPSSNRLIRQQPKYSMQKISIMGLRQHFSPQMVQWIRFPSNKADTSYHPKGMARQSFDHDNHPILAEPTMVSLDNEIASSISYKTNIRKVIQIQGEIPSSSPQHPIFSDEDFWRIHKAAGIPQEHSVTLLKSLGAATKSTYTTYWKQYVKLCDTNSWNPYLPVENRLMTFLNRYISKGNSSGSVSQAKTAICTLFNMLYPLASPDMGNSRIIKYFARGFRAQLPSKKYKYNHFFDLDLITDYFKKIIPDNAKIDLYTLTMKAIMLVRIALVARSADISKIPRSELKYINNKSTISVRFYNAKTNNMRALGPAQHINKSAELATDPFLTITDYIQRTKLIRRNPSYLFIDCKAPHNDLNRRGIARYVKHCFKLCKVPKMFSPHSLKGAIITKAYKKGVKIEELARRSRTSANTLRKHYLRHKLQGDTTKTILG